MQPAPPEVETAVSSYLCLLDERLPGRIGGLYLVGSLALNDYVSGQSDLDCVAVTATPLTPPEHEQLRKLHRQLARAVPRPHLDGIYVTWRQLETDPTAHSVPFYNDGRFEPDGGFNANPVTWHLLHHRPVSVRGPTRPAVLDSSDLLRTWCRENLQGYWAAWVRSARTTARTYLTSLTRWGIAWGVLGVTRLHATIRTGEVLSKSAAGAYALATFPGSWSPVVCDALAFRLSQRTTPYHNAFSRRRAALAFMEHVIADALDTERPSRPAPLPRT